jgi:hypothetical protein
MLNRTLTIILLICLFMPMNLKSQDKTTDTTAGIIGKQKKLNFSLSFLISPGNKSNYEFNECVGFDFVMSYKILPPLDLGVNISWLTGSKSMQKDWGYDHNVVPLEIILIIKPVKIGSFCPISGMGIGKTYHHKTKWDWDDPVEHYSFTNSYSFFTGLQYKQFVLKGRFLRVKGTWEFPVRKFYIISAGLSF